MDEARFGRITDARRCWAPKPERPVALTTVSHENTYAYTAANVRNGQTVSLILPYLNGECMQKFVDELSSRYPKSRVIMVLDGAAWHKPGKMLTLPHNIRLVVLPPNSPQLNPVENLWDELREKFFHNRVFNSFDGLEDNLVDALRYLSANKEIVKSITCWHWIAKAFPNLRQKRHFEDLQREGAA